MSEYLLNGEVLIIEGQKLIAKKVGLSGNQLEESEMLMIEKGLGNHLMMLQSQLRSKVKYAIIYLDNQCRQLKTFPTRSPKK